MLTQPSAPLFAGDYALTMKRADWWCWILLGGLIVCAQVVMFYSVAWWLASGAALVSALMLGFCCFRQARRQSMLVLRIGSDPLRPSLFVNQLWVSVSVSRVVFLGPWLLFLVSRHDALIAKKNLTQWLWVSKSMIGVAAFQRLKIWLIHSAGV